jgi:hypothetical protein
MTRRWKGDERDKRGVLSWDDEKRMQCNIAINECRAMLASALLSAYNFDKVNIAILLILYAFISQMTVIAIIPIHNLREKGI